MVKNIAHSLKVKLLNLSDHDNRRYQQLLVRYMQERFLYRLSESKYCNNFILKGGALLYAYNEFCRDQHWMWISWVLISAMIRLLLSQRLRK